MVPGPNSAHPAEGVCLGHGKRLRGLLDSWGPIAEKVTSRMDAHSLPAVGLCFTCRRIVRLEGSSSVSLMQQNFP